MKSSRVGIHLLSVLLLLLWGGIMLYFYSSGRLVSGEYLTTDGWFRPMVLVAGIALMVLGLFNLSTMGAEEADCCDHELDEKLKHTHDDDCGHKHTADCGHDHHEHHHHKEGESCGHDHHDHGHTHDHAHEHKHEHKHEHAHGILEESGAIGRLVAIFILAVPVSYAAIKSPDRFSAHTAINKGVYAQNYGETATADRYLKKTIDSTKTTENAASSNSIPPPATPPANTTVAAVTASPPPAADSSTKPADALPEKTADEIAKMADPQTKGAQTKSYGTFTLADLKAQVPQNKEGSFLLEVPEIFYTAGDKEVQAVLKGQPVETIAQILPEKVNNEKGTRVRIFRLLVQCCAADARPFSIPVEFGKEPPKFKDMTWVKVTGKMNFLQENNQTIPVLEATSMVESAEPDNKMVY